MTSDDNVASVAADGTVTAKAPGIATVTAITATGATATCTVTVNPPFDSQETLFDFDGGANILGTSLETYSDKNEQGTSDFTIPQIDIANADQTELGALGTGKALKMDYTMGLKIAEGTPYLGLTFKTSLNAILPDLSVYSGIGFWHKGPACTFLACLQDENDTCHTVTVGSSDNWEYKTVYWDDFLQPDWATRYVPWDATKITAFNFHIAGSDADNGTFSLDEIVLFQKAAHPMNGVLDKEFIVLKPSGTATIKPVNSVVEAWTSGNDQVVTVASGSVTAVNTGTAYITATFKNETIAKCRVIVEPTPSISTKTLTVAVGKTDTLKVTTLQNVTWKSNNAEIARVDANGDVTAAAVVTAVYPGTATVTATLEDGTTYICKVTVPNDDAGKEITTLINFENGKAESADNVKILTEVSSNATISPKDPTEATAGGAADSDYCIEFTYTVSDPAKDFALAKIALPPALTDITKYDGIQFWYKGDATDLRIITKTDEDNRYSDYYHLEVTESTEWTKYVFSWDKFTQLNGGGNYPSDKAVTLNFTFATMVSTGQSYKFAFDEVALYQDKNYEEWKTIFASGHTSVNGIDRIISSNDYTWIADDKEYNITEAGDTLTVDFTGPLEIPHTSSFDCYFIDRKSLTDPFRTANADTQVALQGTSVDMSEHPLVSFEVLATQDLTLEIDLIDKDGKVSNRDTNYYYIKGSDKWQTISFAWDSELEATHYVNGAYDSYSTKWFGVPNTAKDQVQHELDMTNIIGLNFIIDQGYVGKTGSAKKLEIRKLAVGDMASPRVYPNNPITVDIQKDEMIIEKLGYSNSFSFEPGTYNSASIEIDFRGEQGPIYENAPKLLVNGYEVSLQQYLPQPTFSEQLWTVQGDGKHRVNTAFHVSVPIPLNMIKAGEENPLTLWPNTDNVKIAKMRLALYGGQQNGVPVTKLVLPASKMLQSGTAIKLSPTMYPSNATDTTLTWYSDNIEIATVDSAGTVNAISEGTAYIYCTSNSGKSAYCEVRVMQAVIDPKTITLSPLTVGVGGSGSMQALVMPAEAIYPALEWKSSNTTVATVDANGTVTGRVPGTATITASIPAANISATALVTVSEAKSFSLIQIPEISLSDEAPKAVYVLENYVKTNAGTVTWSVSYPDNATVTILNGTLSVSIKDNANPGSFILLASGSNGYTSQMLVSVKYNPNPVSGTQDIKLNLVANGTPTAIALKEVFDSYVSGNEKSASPYNAVDDVIITFVRDSVFFSTNAEISVERTVLLQYSVAGTSGDSRFIRITSTKTDNLAPEIKAIPEQVSVRGVFAQIDMSGYVTDDYTLPAYIRWTAGNSAKVRISVSGSMVAAQLVSTAWIGSEPVWLYAQDAAGLRDSVQVLFTNRFSDAASSSSPFIDFKANKLVATPNTDILFTANLAGAEYWIWDFPGALPKSSELLNQTVRYANLGKYSVKLSAEKGTEIDSTVKKNYIQIVGITTRDTVICAGATVQLSVSPSISGHTWSTGSTAASISVSPDKTTKYAISFKSGLRTLTDSIEVRVIPVADLGSDQSICTGQKLVLNPGKYDSYTWSNADATPSLTVADAGTYAVTVSSGKCQSEDAITVTVRATQPVELGRDTLLCPGKTLALTVRAGESYRWNDNVTDQSRTITVAGKYSVSVTDANKCVVSGSITVSFRKPAKEEICVLTTSELTSNTIVAWERSQSAGIVSYIVYRDGLGGFKPLDTIAFADGGVYIDPAADANRTQYTYALATVDGCGTTSELSSPHTSMHVQKFIDANGDYALRWNSYVGKEILGYRIFMENGTPEMMQVDSISKLNTSYTILKSDNKKKYRVAAVFGDTCIVGRLKSDSGPFSQSLSNLSEAIILSSGQRSVSVTAYPNPTAGLFSLSVNTASTFRYSVTNGEGRQVATGSGSGTVKVDISSQPAGVYHLTVEQGAWSDQREIVKE